MISERVVEPTHNIITGEMRMKICLTDKDALIVVDIQVDFLPGGDLSVNKGETVIAPMNEYVRIFSGASRPVFFTRDWHPRNHLSFRENGGPWPPHCVMDTPGAMFPQELMMPAENKHIISNGMKTESDVYSAFQNEQLTSILQGQGVRRVYIGGLATDYCVKNTVLGALNLGFEAVVLLDAIQGIDVNPGDSEKAVRQMLCAGAIGITFQDCIS